MFITKIKNCICFNPWILFSLIITFVLSLPIFSLMTNLAFTYTDTWNTIIALDILSYIKNSIYIIFFQSIFVVLFGVTTAWIVTTYEFPLRKFVEFSLLLPLCIPTYVAAIIYGEIFDYSGDFQFFLRKIFDLDNNFRFPNIRSLPGVIFIFSITLYPYVYIISRAAFSEISRNYSEAGKTLGLNSSKIFFRIFLPIAGFSIFGGVILSILESLNDFGTVQYFGVDTFTTGIYKTWIGLGEIKTAAQLSIFFLFFIFLIIYLQTRFVSMDKINIKSNVFYDTNLIQIGRIKKFVFLFFCLIPIFLGFVIPFSFLITWSLESWQTLPLKTTYTNCLNTLLLALISSFFIIFLSLLISYSSRIKDTKLNNILKKISSMGYAIPGSVIAIGVLVPFTFLDNWLINFISTNFDRDLTSIFSGSIFILFFAYVVRFFTISQINIESAFSRISKNFDDTASVLGKKPFFTLLNIHTPIMSLSIILSLLLVFIEVVKELSATLILRPFNFNTLAVQIYESASEEKIIETAIPSLIIVVLCIIVIIFISKINKFIFLSEKN